MIRSGVPPLDEALGGVVPGRIYLLAGSLGGGKTAACLQFVATALRAGEPAVLITGDDGSDLKSLAFYLGLDIETPLRSGLLQVVRYRPQFAAALAASRSPEVAFADLRKMLGDATPARIAIDPLDPFLGNGGPVNAGSLALASFLDELGATSLLTHTSAPGASFDRRLDPLVGRSVAVLRIDRGRDDAHYLRVLRSRVSTVPPAPIRFEIVPDGGMKTRPPITAIAGKSDSPSARSPRRLLVLHTTETPSDEIADLLDRDYETVVRPAPAPEQPLDLSTSEFDGIVLSVSHDTIAAALSLLCRLNTQDDMVPILVAARFNLRSLDRAHALRAGADEILATDMTAPEFLQRLAGALSRAHLPPGSVSPPYSDALIFQPWRGFGHKPLSRDEFASALATHVSQDNPIQYTVVTFALSEEAGNGMSPHVPVSHLSDVVIRASRIRNGDLTAIIDDCVAVYLHGAQENQAAVFAERVQRVWAGRRRAPLRIESFPYPSGEPELRTMFEVSESR